MVSYKLKELLIFPSLVFILFFYCYISLSSVLFYKLGFILFWLLLFIIINFSLTELYIKEFESGHIELVYFSNISPEKLLFYILIKQWFKTFSFLFLTFPFILNFYFKLSLNVIYYYLSLFILTTLILYLLGSTLVCFMIKLKQNKLIYLYLLTFPYFLPIFFFTNPNFFKELEFIELNLPLIYLFLSLAIILSCIIPFLNKKLLQ